LSCFVSWLVKTGPCPNVYCFPIGLSFRYSSLLRYHLIQVLTCYLFFMLYFSIISLVVNFPPSLSLTTAHFTSLEYMFLAMQKHLRFKCKYFIISSISLRRCFILSHLFRLAQR